VIHDLPTLRRPATPPPTPLPLISELGDDWRSPSHVPSFEDLPLEGEHEVSIRRHRGRRKQAQDSTARTRCRSTRLAAKEDPFYNDATSKATRVKAAQLDLVRASDRMKEALACSGVLERPAPPKIASRKLHLLGRVCGLPVLPEADGDCDTPGVQLDEPESLAPNHTSLTKKH